MDKSLLLNTFNGNEALHGGAIALIFGAEMDISCSRFNNNTSHDGGAIYITARYSEGSEYTFNINSCF